MAKASADAPQIEQYFTQLLNQTQWAVYDFARGLVGEAEGARDIVQDVFVDAWRALQHHAPPFTDERNDAAVRKWLFHVAYCRAVSMLRHRSVITWEPLSMDDALRPDLSREHMPLEDQVAEAEVLRAALQSLGPQDAACLLLSVIQGFTSSEIAHIVDISPEAAKKRLTRAKQRLRAAYFAQHAQPQERTRP